MTMKICIVGGGSSGWCTAAHLVHNLPRHEMTQRKIKITLIESTKKGIIGVGEGTQPFTTQFFTECGLERKDWMKASDATYKLGVEFIGWSDTNAFVDNDTPEMNVLGPEVAIKLPLQELVYPVQALEVAKLISTESIGV